MSKSKPKGQTPMYRAVHKRPGRAPTVIDLGGADAGGSHHEAVSRLMDGGVFDRIPGGPDRLSVYVDDNGLQEGLPPNCKGLVGPILILKVNPKSGEVTSMGDADVERAVSWLADGNPAGGSSVTSVLAFLTLTASPTPAGRPLPDAGADSFAAETQGLTPADRWVRDGHKFKCDVHFTGFWADRPAVERVRGLVKKYAEFVAAYADNSVPNVTQLPGMFTVELQFADSPAGRRAADRCRRESK